jgi:hypothetical protein
VIREAITEYITRREQERFMEEIVAAARALATDPESRREILEIAEDTVDDGLDAIITEERAAGKPNEKWWR